MPVPVWGWAAAQSEVTVSFKAQRKTTRADADGRWQVVLEVCRGANFYAYATVAENLQVAADGAVEVTLVDAVANDPFNRPDLTTPPAAGASPSSTSSSGSSAAGSRRCCAAPRARPRPSTACPARATR